MFWKCENLYLQNSTGNIRTSAASIKLVDQTRHYPFEDTKIVHVKLLGKVEKSQALHVPILNLTFFISFALVVEL